MVTKEDESGDMVIQVGTDFDWTADFSMLAFERGQNSKYLFEVVQVGLGLVRPQSWNIFREFEGFGWSPVFHKTLLVSGDYGIISVTELWYHQKLNNGRECGPTAMM
jgi:hypothetical protein